jgi:hypothetical protein
MLLTVVAGVSLLVAAGYGGDTKARIVSGLLSMDPLTRQAAFNQVISERTGTIQALVSLLDRKGIDKSYQGTLHRAIVLLGMLRAKAAVAPLSAFLLYVPEGFETEEETPTEAYYVATVALAHIGFPAIEPMLGRIRMADGERERHLAAWVIMEIEGREQALNRLNALAQSGRSQAVRRFEAAAKYIATYEPTFTPPSAE